MKISPSTVTACLAIAGLATLTASSLAASQVAYWSMDETESPYANLANPGNPLLQDAGTSTAGASGGISGNATQLIFADPGPATRLASTSNPQTSDSFGFSFFINPIFLGEFNSFLQKETEFTVAPNDFEKLAWQVHLLGNNGSGFAPVELVLRGDGFGFAATTSTALLKLDGDQSGNWIHIAGGYDASTGATTLFVRDMALDLAASMTSSVGSANIFSDDDAPLSLGTGKYQGNAVAFAASTLIDDIRIFDAPLTAEEVAAIELAVPEPGAFPMAALGAAALFAVARRRLRTV